MNSHTPRECAQGLGLVAVLLALYLLTYSGGIHATDEMSMFAVADSLAKWGAATTNQVLWVNVLDGSSNAFAPDGNMYSKKGPATSLLMLPLCLVARFTPGLGLFQTALLLNSLVTAATAWLVWAAARRLGFSSGASLATGLAYGAGTMAWVHARYLYSEPAAGLFLMLAFYVVQSPKSKVQSQDERGGRLRESWAALGAGLALGMAVAARYANLALAPLFLAYLVWRGWRQAQPSPRSPHFGLWTLGFGLSGLGVVMVGLGAYNLWRFGSPLDTGYAPEESFATPLWQGVAGMLFSPGRSLFVFSPLLLAALYGFRWLLRSRRAEALLVLGVFGGHLLLYGAWYQWWGGLTWGPRFLLPALPFLALGLAPLFQRARASPRLAAALCLLAALGLAVNLVGLLSNFTQAPSPDDSLSPVIWSPREWPLRAQISAVLRGDFDVAWLRSSIGSVDGLALGASALTLILAVAALALACRTRNPELETRNLVPVGLALTAWAAAALFCLQRYDSRVGANLGLARSGLLQRLTSQRRPGDAVVFNMPLHQEWLLNADKNNLPSYGYARDTLQKLPPSLPLLERVVRQHRRIWLPIEWTPPGDPASQVEAWLAAHAYPLDNQWFGDEARLVLFVTHPGDPEALVPAPVFDGDVRLAAASVAVPWRSSGEGTGQARAGEVLVVALRWQPLRPLRDDLKVFVHVAGWAGPMAQADGVPGDGFRPASGWQPGETVIDNHALRLPAGIAPGEYRVVVGLYRAAAGRRLRLEGGGDAVELRRVRVE